MTRAHQHHVSIVVPFYNEGAGVEAFCNGILPVMAQLPQWRFEVICVDDGSSDDTLARLLAVQRDDERFQVLELSRNFGKEAALTAGLDATSGDAVVVIDADLQDPPELIVSMLARWEKGAEIVLARRTDRHCDSLLKRKTAQWFYRLHNLVSDIAIPPDVGDFRLMDRRVVDALRLLPERQRFMKGMFCWVGFQTVVIDYTRRPRAVGRSKFHGWKLWNLALEGITSFSTAPLRIWTYVGVACAALTALYALYTFARTLWWGIELPGYASLLLSVLFFGSLHLISLGLIGEYVGRIYVETKQRPIYLLRNRHVAGQRPSAERHASAGQRRSRHGLRLVHSQGLPSSHRPSVLP